MKVKVIKCAVLSYDYLNVFVLLCTLEVSVVFFRMSTIGYPFSVYHGKIQSLIATQNGDTTVL